ncbi:MAG: tRNA guanosine(34) transglycosylase Tgt [Lewinellaceae bacterium]|nr:tRNA guanosine(34) transglycosylase Tgt [Saprospiraceae bacterium]MCB9338326.1 tRNA guanosine(34) transglycosylase Tgt [Lewinellaceae bacterium]
MFFQLQHTDPSSSARAGILETAHGHIETPIFMPVGTVGAVKAVHQHELVDVVQAQIILGNTYHLYLRPGTDVLQKAGGLHQFMGWDRPILTDSGGYQVYSLSSKRKIKEEGVTFTSHLDGSKHFFSPESAVDTQREIGADIIMALDECTPYPCDYHYAKNSMGLTHRWLQRCCGHFDKTAGLYGYEQNLFPIVQGSTYRDLRKESAEVIAAFDRVGNAIGGLSVGEPEEDMYEMTELVCGILPKEKPRYLMGVGTPFNILECIALGVDMFDCVLPTRNARHGLLYTAKGVINIKNAKWKEDFSAIDENSTSHTSRHHTKAYLRHLIHTGEILGAQIATLHNLCFYLWLVKEARLHIIAGDFNAWKNGMVASMRQRL